METALVILAVIALIVIGWFWRARQYDNQTTLDFDSWVSKYDSASSPSQRSAMAISLMHQAIQFSWAAGAINSKQREAITEILQNQRATTTMIQWMGTALPAVIHVIGEQKVANSPARVVGALMLLSLITEQDERESAIRNFLTLRLP